jgi:hypothetical protein
MKAVEKRLREEFAKLQVEVNEEKSRTIDLSRGESFGFLGFDFRRIRSRKGKWCAQYTPKLKKRTALLRELKDMFRRHQSQPVSRVVQLINPMLRGWVSYFAIGHASECFGFIRDWVVKKIRRHMMRSGNARASAGHGGVGKDCTKSCICLTATGFGGPSNSCSSKIGPISFGVKFTGERSAGNPHATFDVAGAGNGAWPS